MKPNVGSLDRFLRLLLGGGLVVYAVVGKAPWAYVGLVLLVTAVVGFCPLYTLFKFSSCPTKPR